MSIRDLKDRLVAAGANKRDQVITLIEECLREGMRDGTAIRQQLIGLGYDGQFVGIQLSKNAGPSPMRHQWFKDENGDYRLHPASTEDN